MFQLSINKNKTKFSLLWQQHNVNTDELIMKNNNDKRFYVHDQMYDPGLVLLEGHLPSRPEQQLQLCFHMISL
jgi:hypothetical protein